MVEITHAPPEDREEIAQFMRASFPRAKWSIEGWRRLLAGRWSGPDDSYGVIVRDGGKLVGAIGLITAGRITDAGPAKTANLTSWYVLKPYRAQGVGHRMLELATADPAVTVTNLSSSKGAIHVVESAGFSVLDSERLIWRPRPRVPTRLRVHPDPITLGGALSAKDRRVLADHAGLNLTAVAIETADGPCVVVLSIKQKCDAFVTHEVMYMGNRALFARHVRAIADSLLPLDRAVLSVDRRFMPADADPDAVEQIEVARYYTAGRMPPEEVDHLYSEIVLMDMKLY